MWAVLLISVHQNTNVAIWASLDIYSTLYFSLIFVVKTHLNIWEGDKIWARCEEEGNIYLQQNFDFNLILKFRWLYKGENSKHENFTNKL